MIKALIFDFDGLILDTETPEYQALNEVYKEYGHSLSIEIYGRVVGAQYGYAFEPVIHLQSLTGKSIDYNSFWERVNQRRMDVIEHSPLLPGVEAHIQAAKARGLKLAVASSSPHSWVDGHLKRLGMFRYFDVVMCKDDVREVKPDPELFLAALSALHLQPEEAVVYEDSPNGVLAARRAGMRVVLIPNPVTAPLHFEGETIRLRSLAEMPLDDLLQKI
jgi:HAD superfamily hydrolase (TIGR01509 family)